MTSRASKLGAKNLFVANYFLFYYVQMLFYFLNWKLFYQVQPKFFTYKPDLTELLLIVLGVPKFVLSHPSLFVWMDAIVLLLPLAILAFYIRKNRFSVVLGVAFTLSISVYFLLQSLLLQISLESLVPYLLFSFLFFSNKEEHFELVIKVVRYLFLYVMATAAIWKIMRGAVFQAHEMQNILIEQHIDHLTSDSQDFVSTLHLYLIHHASLSQTLYVLATLLELCFVIGFFTRRYDRWLLAAAFVFILADHLVMRLPYWNLFVCGITLWLPYHPKNLSTTYSQVKA